ncbi:hypothetical protein [Streptomyces violascens]|uniref:hypothetical protein n=1 Tax=Streptomyces violascens TaxID=67381 RepID=UPI0036D01743
MTTPRFTVAPLALLSTSDLNSVPDTVARQDVSQGGDGYPGIRLVNTDNVPVPPQGITVTLPGGQYDGKLNFSDWSHNLTLKWPSTGNQSDIPGTLSPDGKTMTFPQTDLKLSQRDDRVMMWLPVHAHEDAPPGDTNLTFTIGDQEVPLGQGSYPADLTILGPKLYCVRRGLDSDQRLYFNSFDGTNWSPSVALPNSQQPASSAEGPALAVYNNKLYCVHVSSSGDKSLWYTSFDGTNWTPDQQIPHGMASDAAPALAVYNNKLYCVHVSSSGDKVLWYTSFDGTNWTPGQYITGVSSDAGPALAVYNNKLYCAHLSSNSDGLVHIAAFDGTNWLGDWQAPVQGGSLMKSGAGPALAVYNNKLYCAHLSDNSDGIMYLACSDGGANWLWDSQVRVQDGGLMSSTKGPALAVYNNKLYCAHLSARGEEFVFLAAFDGSNWSPDQMVQGGAVRSAATPALAVY